MCSAYVVMLWLFIYHGSEVGGVPGRVSPDITQFAATESLWMWLQCREALFLLCWPKVLEPAIFGSDNLKFWCCSYYWHFCWSNFWPICWTYTVGPTNGQKVSPTEGPKFIPTATFLQCREFKIVGSTILSQKMGKRCTAIFLYDNKKDLKACFPMTWFIFHRLRFTCHICAKAFIDKTSLQDHVLMHENRRNFKCDKCGQAFNIEKYLLLHIKRIHGTINFSCISWLVISTISNKKNNQIDSWPTHAPLN